MAQERGRGSGPAPWSPPPHLGARLAPDGSCSFRVWAPLATEVELVLPETDRRVPLARGERGYFTAIVPAAPAGTRYTFLLDGRTELPDPASRSQPDGVHGPSAVVARPGRWTDAGWTGVTVADLVIYELHVGTFTPAGTFEAIIPRLPALRELGITAIQLMPIAQFPGTRNWGYDGVFPFAAQNSYGGPEGIAHLVDAAHAVGMAVLLDVVCNHVGPEGNHLARFGPYFTDRYRTAWGAALNFDGAASDEVRAFFIASARQWLDEFHIDGLRLDAAHAITDTSAYPFLHELTDAVRALERSLGRTLVVIAESDLADPRLILPGDRGGLAMDAQWLDDFHHALHALLTGERDGYYRDYGELEHLARAFRQAYVYAGDYSPFRGRRHGRRPVPELRPEQFVVFAQNHDQVGNRAGGERLASLITTEPLKLAAAAVLLAPYVPLLFMGEEYGERAPFPYFVSHTDTALAVAVREGRKAELTAFGWDVEPPDPLAESTLQGACLQWEQRTSDGPGLILGLYHDLLRIRRAQPLLTRCHELTVAHGAAAGADDLLSVRRSGGGRELLLLLNFGDTSGTAPLPAGRWRTLLDTAHARYGGPGQGRLEARHYQLDPHSAVLLEQDPT